MKTMLFNPYTGKPRDPRDIASDPTGTLMIDPDEPLAAAREYHEQQSGADAARLDWLQRNFHSRQLDDFERNVQKLACWSWMFYAPKDVQGDIRNVIDDAMQKERP